MTSEKKILVIGGGVGGIRTALDLADGGNNVVLIDSAYSIGGLMTQLDRTFPTNNCDLCTISPHLSESGRNLHIELMPMTTLEKLNGAAGDFTVDLLTKPRYIDTDKCTACGDCAEKYPECVRFTPGLDPRAPTCMRYPKATPYSFSIDMEKCQDVEGLKNVCKAGAIIPEQTETPQQINVGSIVMCTGAQLFDPAVLDNFGGGKFPNVVSGLEYERIMSASGPTQGELVRPSDGKQPKKVAWIQCVGSRGINKADVPYCSSVCCMYALKEAIVTKERFQNDIEATIFYMDMRTFGKNYEQYLARAQNEFNVKLVRSRPHSITMDNETKDLMITFTTDDSPSHITETFDMVVLSTGFRVSEQVVELSNRLGIELNEHNFAQTSGFNPVATSKSGIYVCGVSESPKDIPETMVQASAAACMASTHITTAVTDTKQDTVSAESEDSKYEMDKDELPSEIDVADQPLRIGVFVCDCGLNIGGVIPTQKLVDFAATLPDVVEATCVGHGCSSEAMRQIEDTIKEKQLNRVVIGGCSPRTHEKKFQDTLRQAGLNKYLVDIANIRDQATWVHMDLPELAEEKAEKLIHMSVNAVRQARPLTDHTMPISQAALVVGGGVTGMNAALAMADKGFKVYLVERNRELGGLAQTIKKTLEGEDIGSYVQDLIKKVENQKNIQVLTQAIVVDHSGIPGMFRTGLQVGPRMHYMELTHGVSIFATGALANRPQEYLLGQNKAVMTQLDLDTLLEEKQENIKKWQSIVMIQCVGSRVPENPNCSRVCCQAAIKNAIRIKELNPEAQIFILNRDIRTYGFAEDYYRKARELGVIFVRYRKDQKPEVEVNGNQVEVTFYDAILGRNVQVTADCLALSTGFIADDETTEDLASIFHISRTDDGYFMEDHIKLRPLDLAVPGFFIAGTAHAPKNIRESITQAQGAAGRAITMLVRNTINLGASVARVDGTKCAACLICVRACPFDIPFINADGYSEIDPSKCQGCGACAAECPAKAIQLMQYEDDIILAKVEGLFERIS